MFGGSLGSLHLVGLIRDGAFLTKTHVTETEFLVFRIHIIIITTIVTEFVLIVLNSPAKVRSPFVCLILLGSASSFALKHSLIKRARGDFVRLYLRLFHFLVDLNQLLGLLAGSAGLEQAAINKFHVTHRFYF